MDKLQSEIRVKGLIMTRFVPTKREDHFRVKVAAERKKESEIQEGRDR